MMKEISRWTLLLLCLALLFVLLPGCGGGGGNGATGGDGDKVEIVFWHSYVSYTNPAIERLIDRFESEHPNISVRTQYVQTGDVMLQKLTTALMTGTVPDMCWVRTNWIPPLVEEGSIFDLDELVEKYGGFSEEERADFVPCLVESATYKGEMRVLPIQATCMSLGYNKDLVKKAGLDPNVPPDTWTDMIGYADKLTKRHGPRPADVDQWGFRIPVFTGQLANYGVWQWKIFLWGEGGRYATPDGREVAFNSPAGVRALQYWVDLQHKYEVATMSPPELGFESQKLAIDLAGCWDLPHLEEMTFDWGIWPMPAGSKERIFPVDGEYMVIFRDGPHPEEAWEFTKWFVSPEVQEQWSMDAKYLPVRLSTYERESYQEYLKTDPGLKGFADQLEYAYNEPTPFQQGTEIDLILASAIEEAVRDVKSPKQALDEAAVEANAVLAKLRAKEEAEANRP